MGISEYREYCQGDTFKAECQEGEVILMKMAKYGRMHAGKCISTAYELKCEKDVLPYFDHQCSGRGECSVYIAGEMLYKMNPCSKELAPYLEADYTCVKGERL